MDEKLQGRNRVIIENVTPQIDAGKFAVKRTAGENVIVEADIFADGHDSISAVVKFRHEKNPAWCEAEMELVENDRWRGEFAVSESGNYFYTVEAWINRFESWRKDLKKKMDAGQMVAVELLVGAEMVEEAADRATGTEAKRLHVTAKQLHAGKSAEALDDSIAMLVKRFCLRKFATVYEKELRVTVDRERARFGAWYELFPRSFGGLRGCGEQLPRLAKMGFDVLYLPPIHPIGKSFRKGKNNNVKCEPGEPGSPWAIGSSDGGHKAIHSELGTLEDFKNLISSAGEHKIEIALDIAFQCSPDHPYVREHPEWCIGELKAQNPELIFLAEAFTRRKPMYRLAKLGFTQSYNYFPWRNSKDELETYFNEIMRPPIADFLRANLWPNTPDILTQFLQMDGQSAFAIRFILAATLGASYGIYGPAFELCENAAREQGSEEYLNSEKYEIKRWDLSTPQSLENLIARVNQIRRDNRALQSDRNLKFHPIDNPELIAYTKSTDDGSETVLVIVNLNPHYKHSGWLELPLEDFGLDARKTYQMHDLLTDARYLWRGTHNYVELNPVFSVAHIFRLRRHVRTERDFDYFT